MCKAYVQCCPSPDQQDLFFWKCSGQLVCQASSKAPVLINTTSPPGNAQGSWCVRHTVLSQSRPTRPILLEMLRAAGVSGIQCCPSSDQQDLSFWKCSGQLVCQHTVLPPFRPTRPILLEMSRKHHVLVYKFILV